MANNQLFDVRILDRNFQKGLITREEYDKYIADLSDMEGQSEKIQAEFVEGVLDKGEEE